MIEATSCGGVVIHRGKILALYKSYKNRYEGWVLPKGTVEPGETHEQTALREVKEEVGLDLTPDCGRLVFPQVRDRIDGRKFGDILDVWLFTYDGEVDLSNATTKEVAQTRWMTPEQIDDLYQSDRLVRTLGYFFEKIAGKNIAE